MKPNALNTRRQALLSLAGLALSGSPVLALAQSDKPVRFILPVSAGSGVDAITRASSNQLGKALGAELTLFTRSPGKEADARRLGADHIVLSTDAAQMKAVRNRFDLIIDTVPYAHDLNPYLPTLRHDGTLVLVGFLGKLDAMLNTTSLVVGRKAVAGSFIGGLPETQEMLDFCGARGVTSDVEIIRMQDINAAYARMLRSDVKYRFVIDMASLKAV